ncbi:MAG: glycoside hydrolase 5 family protein, partial [Vulcanimicrobiaceae bacterium]
MNAGDRFAIGVNYWPRSSAMAMWRRFDRGEIAEDFARIAALKFSVVRCFLMWEAFQPEPRTIDATALARLDAVVELAVAYKLQLMP